MKVFASTFEIKRKKYFITKTFRLPLLHGNVNVHWRQTSNVVIDHRNTTGKISPIMLKFDLNLTWTFDAF